MPYALIPIGLTALLLYGFTFILSRAGLLSYANHKKIWNTALLLTFLATAILGLILAIQVNYKLELPLVDRLIIWHVDFGTGMSFIAIFHFSWHWSYYRKLIGKARDSESTQKKTEIEIPRGYDTEPPDSTRKYNKIPSGEKIPLLTLGATAMLTQVIFLREYLAVFHGNELVIGLILAAWLLLTGCGALIGRNIPSSGLKSNFTSAAFFFLGLIPILTVTGIRFFKNIVFPAGSITGIPGILLYSISGMFLFCILSGFLFTWLSAEISKKQRANLVNLSYGLESAGSIAAGILFSFLLVYILDTYQILFILLLLNLLTAIISRHPDTRRNTLIYAALITGVAGILVFPLKLDSLTRSFLFPNQELVETRDTPYGNIVVCKSGEQYTLFENSIPISVSSDISSVEEDVHYAMLQHPDPKNILVLSGNLAGLVNEIAKYSPGHADFLELDPWITRIRHKYIPHPENSWLQVVHMDGRRFLRRTGRNYDNVLVNLPPPGSAGVNRYYTSEFFREVKARMEPSGILSIPLHGSENYLNEEAGKLYSILYHTMKLHFNNVLLIPGMKTYFLASDEALDIDIPGLVKERGIETEYVNGFYLDRNSLNERNLQLMDAIATIADNTNKHSTTPNPVINSDYKPLAFLHQISYWLSYFQSRLWISIGIFLLLIFLTGLRASPLRTGLFITGFTGMGIELVVLLAIQVVFGYVYLYVAIILTVFMMGLATGALLIRSVLPGLGKRHFPMLQILLAACVLLLLWWIMFIENRSIPDAILQSVFLLLTFATSFITGLLFATASLLSKEGIAKTAGGLYSADLAGSAAGSLITAIVLIPLLGIHGCLLALLALNLLAFIYTLIRRSAI